ncbi:hypothetical protein MYX76_07985 [Desulfobacterota bacterium AH_259_B03_O07]|nr:hypothetical protein [Desulfobacterota bacterium AH_259_B03_O07]
MATGLITAAKSKKGEDQIVTYDGPKAKIAVTDSDFQATICYSLEGRELKPKLKKGRLIHAIT